MVSESLRFPTKRCNNILTKRSLYQNETKVFSGGTHTNYMVRGGASDSKIILNQLPAFPVDSGRQSPCLQTFDAFSVFWIFYAIYHSVNVLRHVLTRLSTPTPSFTRRFWSIILQLRKPTLITQSVFIFLFWKLKQM